MPDYTLHAAPAKTGAPAGANNFVLSAQAASFSLGGQTAALTYSGTSSPSGYDPNRSAVVAGLLKGLDPTDYADSAAVVNSGFYNYGSSGDPPIVLADQITLETGDAVFGKFVRLTHVVDSHAIPQFGRGSIGPTDGLAIRYVFRLSTSPAYTTNGTGGPSSSPAQKWIHIHMPGGGESARTRVDFEGSTAVTAGFVYPGKSFTAALISQPAGTTALSAININTTIRDSGEWWECINWHEKTGTYTGRQREYFRRLTSGGAINPGSWFFTGWNYTSNPADTYTFPQASEGVVLVNRNKDADVAMYIDQARIEYIDTTVIADPHGVASIGA